MTEIQLKRRQYYERKKAEGYYERPCPLCGRKMAMSSIRCVRHRPDGSLIEEVSTECPVGGRPDGCHLKGPHRHCDCGEPIIPDLDGGFAPDCAHCVRWAERMARKRLALVS